MTPSAYLYSRVSSTVQLNGQGIDRQDERGFEYFNRVIASTGLTLDNTVRCDKGRSAFKGSNLKEDAALRKILDEIAAGTIASGSILIVENLDRISRQGPKLARQVLARVTDNGVEIHILNINQMLKKNWENDFGQSVVVDNELQRAWKESLYKSDRIGRAWKAKKDNAANKVLTKNVPGWLRVVDGKIVEIPEKVALVREVYRLACLGVGITMIVRQLRQPCVTRNWVTKVLNSRKVLGEYSVDAPNYYPRIIEQSVFDSAREQAARKRKSFGGSNVAHTLNLFVGLFRDITSHQTMYFQKAKRSYIRNDKHFLHYDRFEQAFLQFIQDLDWKAIAGETESDEVKVAQQKVEAVLADLDKTARLIAKRTAEMEDPDLDSATVKVFAGQIAKATARVVELETEKDKLNLTLQAARARCEALHTPEELLKLIGQNDLRLRLRAEIRKRIARIDFNFSSGKGPVCFIWFVNQANRMIDFRNGETIPAYQRSFERSMVSSEQITPLLGDMAKPHSKKTTKVETATAPAPVAANDQLHADFLAKHKATPIIFTERQKNGKRYNAVLAATSLESVDMSFFKDEKDLKTFVRWILRGAPGHKPPTAKVAAA